MNKIRYSVAGELLRRFVVSIFVYTCIVGIIFSIVYLLGQSVIWYGTETLYPALVYVKRHWAFFFTLTLFIGCMFISAVNFVKFAKILDDITSAVSDLASERVSYVKLPGQVHQVEIELNQIINQMQQDRQLAQEAKQRKDDMIVYMAHDMKTPLTSVIGYLSLLHDEQQISEQTRMKYTDIALRKAQRLEDLTNEFFEITKYNFSDSVLLFSKVNISMMLEQIIYEFDSMFKEKNLSVDMNIEQNIYIQCDIEKMERVFDNLFKNAVNYAYANTIINIGVRREKGEVIISVQNSGKTIPKEKLEHIFEQFFRLDSSRNSSTGGSGLGLAIAREIVTLHHGQIICNSENEIIEFLITLPIVEQN